MDRFVIVAYRPKPGQAAALDALVDESTVRVLAQQGLISDRRAVRDEGEGRHGSRRGLRMGLRGGGRAGAHERGSRRDVGRIRRGLRLRAARRSCPERAQMFAEFDAAG